MPINPKFLLQLVEIVEKGSFTEAADALHVTQPALSRNMREFEQQLGPAVLERGRLGARPTDFGDRVLRYAQVVHEMLNRIEFEASAWQRGEIGSMQIGATPHPSLDITQVLSDYLEDRPELTASLMVSDVPTLLAKLESGDLDIVVGPTGMIQSPHSVVTRHLFLDELVLVAGRRHPLVGAASISIADLQSSSWVGHPLTSLIHRQATSILVAQGVTDVRVQCRVSMFPEFVTLLESGRYIAILPRRPLAEEIRSGRVVELPLSMEGAQWPVGILHRSAPMLPKSVELFTERLVEAFAQ